MIHRSYWRSCQASNCKGVFAARQQSGQALVYGLFMLMAGVAALYFLFNVGQLTQEKTKLVNTSDAVAYSAGVMHARAMNYMAYTNRAMVADEVTIAQAVSLASWGIDVVYLNEQMLIVQLDRNIPPWRMRWGGKDARHTLEMSAGGIDRFKLHIGGTID